ncbi:PIN domain-containing protein [Patescibacteria group bacterium]|nr:PIN domain-containing protein [Patescibacteria group bacterium]
MIILDSSVWIAFFNNTDSQHKKAQKIFQELNEKIILPEYVIIEVCSVLLLKASVKITNNFIEIALNNTEVGILLADQMFFYNTLNGFKNILNEKLSFIDSALLYLSKSYKIITFDGNLDTMIKKANI